MREDVIRAAVLALAGGSAVGAARFAFKFIVKSVGREFRDAIEEVVVEHIEPIKKRTEELVPNHGSSLADAIRRIEKRLNTVEDELEEIKEAG